MSQHTRAHLKRENVSPHRRSTRVPVNSPKLQQIKEEKKESERRYYARGHKYYHVWNDRKDGTFHRWLDERHDQTHRTFSKLKSKEQSEYWKWRHEHPNNDADRH